MPETPKKELSMEMRLLLAFGLMTAVLFVTPYLYDTPPTPAQPAKKTAPAAKPSAPATTPASSPPPAAAQASPSTSAPAEETVVVETSLYKVTFSNRGAVVRSWILKKYDGSLIAGEKKRAPLDLVNT
ncbi:MAG: membrane protein insertase YidC, partial [Bryobacteraceae bacterium]